MITYNTPRAGHHTAREMDTIMARMLVIEKYELIQVVNGNTIVHGVSGEPMKDSSDNGVSQLIEHYYKNRKQYGAMQVIGQKTRNVYATLGSK